LQVALMSLPILMTMVVLLSGFCQQPAEDEIPMNRD
jgi:hypothetical protein